MSRARDLTGLLWLSLLVTACRPNQTVSHFEIDAIYEMLDGTNPSDVSCNSVVIQDTDGSRMEFTGGDADILLQKIGFFWRRPTSSEADWPAADRGSEPSYLYFGFGEKQIELNYRCKPRAVVEVLMHAKDKDTTVIILIPRDSFKNNEVFSLDSDATRHFDVSSWRLTP